MNIPNKQWLHTDSEFSLSESHASVYVPKKASFWKKFISFAGPGLLIAVGYMDPGNWATDIEGGSKFGYTLLSVILISNLIAILLQYLSLKLGIATDKDLAQACRTAYSRRTSFILWIFAEIAITATDLAEVIGSAIAIQLLFGIPLPIGVIITAIDVLLILFLQHKGFRYLEAFVGGLIGVIFSCFVVELFMSKPVIHEVISGLMPASAILTHGDMLYIAIGILGATVMPHNLYLHSSIIQTRKYERSPEGKREAIQFATIDSTVSLLLAFFINAAILILAASAFHSNNQQNVADIYDAHRLLEPLLGNQWASVLFAVALLAAGQNSTLTGTLAGQIVMEGFLKLKIKPWLRRMITRLIAIIPAMAVAIYAGESGTGKLLVFSQVILSMQLGFAVIPLVRFTGNKKLMGEFSNSPSINVLAWCIGLIIVALNVYMLLQIIF